LRAKVKSATRAIQKVRRAYKDDCTCITDVVRAAVIFENVEDLRLFLEVVHSQAKIVRVKNRMSSTFNSEASAGYRDVALNIAVPLSDYVEDLHFVCELQLILESMYLLKSEGGHKRYVSFRDRRGD